MSEDEKKEGLPYYPLWDFLLITPIVQEKTKAGVILPQQPSGNKGPRGGQLDDTQRGIVVAAGPGCYRESGAWVENPIKVGDVVYFMGMTMPFMVVIDGVKYLSLSGRDCIAVANRPMDRPAAFQTQPG